MLGEKEQSQAMVALSDSLAGAVKYQQAGRLEQAERACRQILQVNPKAAGALNLLGMLNAQMGYGDIALDYVKQAIAIDDSKIAYFKNLASLFQAAGQLDEAAACWQQFAQAQPDTTAAHLNLAAALAELGRLAEAAASYRRALQLQPGHAGAHNNLGIIYLTGKKYAAAEQHFQHALKALPDNAEICFNLGIAQERQNKIVPAQSSFRQALQLKPDNVLWQLKLDGVCPAIMSDKAAIRTWRAQFETALDRYPAGSIDLNRWLPELLPCNVAPPYLLHYQGEDDRALKSKYANLFSTSGVTGKLHQNDAVPPQPRLGFLVDSGNEAVFVKLMGGVISNLDLPGCQLTIICTRAGVEKIAPHIKNEAVNYLPAMSTNMAATIQSIQSAQFALIYFFEVGSGLSNYFLPFFRLAPVQCTSWGITATTGIPHMDYYLSSQYFETGAAAAHYSETLVRLDTLPACLPKPALPNPLKTRGTFGLAADRHIYLCPQTRLKFHPDFDPLLAEILRRDPGGMLVLVIKDGQAVHDKLWLKRLQSNFPDVVERIHFVPRQNYDNYLNLMAVSDVVLDTPHFSGGMTTFDGLAVGTPIVTLSGQFMRGRMTTGCYRRMDVMDCVAATPEAYIAIAVKLGTDKNFRKTVRSRILAANDVLYEDTAVVRAYEQFFRQVLGQAPVNRQPTEIATNQNEAEIYFRQGVDLWNQGRGAEAVDYFQQSLQCNANRPEIYNYLGVAQANQGQYAEAIANFRQALAYRADYIEAHKNLGGALGQTGDFAGAIDCFKQGLHIAPDYVELHYNLAVTYEKLGQPAEAENSYRQVLRLQPGHVRSHNNLGIVALGRGDILRAKESFEHALRLNPEFAPAHYYLASLYQAQADVEMAARHYHAAAQAEPENILWRLEQDLLCPQIMPNNETIKSWRNRIDAALDAHLPGSVNLGRWQMKISGSSNVYPPVHLAYHGQNERPLREKLAALFQVPDVSESMTKERQQGPYRIGFLVTKNHEMGLLYFVAGLINHLDRTQFAATIICPVPSVARIKPAINGDDVEFLTIPENLGGAVQKIKAAALDLIYFWEVGTDTLNYLLPFYRLAPVQCVSWGAPTTTGVPAVDYYISSKLFENPDAEAHYTEYLVQLKGLPTYYRRPALPKTKKSRSHFGLPEQKHIYLCCQNLMKLHPSFDAILARILRRDPLGIVALVGSHKPEITAQLVARLKTSVPDVVDHIQLLAGQNYADYLSLLGVADVILDTPHFNGGATSLEALSVGAPVVTLPGQFMRGRMTYGCYQKMEMMDCVASSVEEYVNIALKLGTDESYRQAIKSKIAAQNHLLFEDKSAVREIEQFFRRAIAGQIKQPARRAEAEEFRRQGLRQKREQRPAEAVGSFRRAVALDPTYVEAYNNLGTTLAQLGELVEAEEILRQAVRRNNTYAPAHFNLGLVLQYREKPAQAETSFRRALQLNPGDEKSLANLGMLLQDRGQFTEAAACFRKLLDIRPDDAEAYHHLGLSLAEQGKLAEAAEALRQTLKRQPEHPESLYNLGVILVKQDNLEAAEAQFQQALALRPNYAQPCYGLGNIFFRRREYELAEQNYRKYLQLQPDDVEARYVLAVTLRALEKFEAAVENYRRVLALQPNNRLRQLEADTLCPSIMDDAGMIRQWRSHVEAALENYPPGAINLQAQLPEISGNVFPPLELAYHGLNDRPLKEKFAAIFSGPPAPQRRVFQPGAPHRIGFLVTRNHERGFLQFMAGLLPHFNRSDFEITVICPAAGLDQIQAALNRGQVDILPTTGDLAVDIQKIKEKNLDLLYYWEIGTDTQNYLLPFFRPAPVQCATWAVPTTTGIPQVDYFISSRLFEAEGAAAHYSERLVQLQSLGVYFRQPQLGSSRRGGNENENQESDSGIFLTPNSPPLTPENIYICPQNLKKFHPDFDPILAEILRRDPLGKLVLKNKFQQLTDDLVKRFRRTIPAVLERIQFVPEQSYQDYLQLIATADVALDTVGYTGGTTSFECLAVGLPVVTLPTQFMRGRMTLGCYRKIGVMDCVVNSPQEYVDMAVKLGTDRRYRHKIKTKILAANSVLYEDRDAAQELEQFFRQAIAAARIPNGGNHAISF